jgi:hypothetical protein
MMDKEMEQGLRQMMERLLARQEEAAAQAAANTRIKKFEEVMTGQAELLAEMKAGQED